MIPLFGAHHTVLMVMSIAAVTPLYELYWLYIDQLFTSFQVSGRIPSLSCVYKYIFSVGVFYEHTFRDYSENHLRQRLDWI